MAEQETIQNGKESRTQSNYEASCQICGYFVGASSVCHRCGARTKTRTSIRSAKIAAIAGSIVGIILLWTAAYLKQPRLIEIGEITPTMNNALVVVEGSVVEVSRDRERNSFRMTVSDNTGNIRINAFDRLSQFLEHFDGELPSTGDTVRITGALNISQSWGAAMFLTIPERIEITDKFKMEEIDIGDITVDHSDELFIITADVEDYSAGQTRGGDQMHRLTFRDRTGRISSVLWQNQFEALTPGAREALSTPGSRIRAAVRGSSYRNQPQVEISDPADPASIEVLSIPDKPLKVEKASLLDSLPPKKLGEITTAHSGESFKISVTVENYQLLQTRAGDDMHRLTLGDETDIITMIIWSGQFNALEERARQALTTQGSRLRLAVEGDAYRNQPQVKLLDPYDPAAIEIISRGE